MKALNPNSFYREQILANLRFVEKEVDVLTCSAKYGHIVAFAYAIRSDGKRVKIMQASSSISDATTALRKLHDMSSKYLQNYLAGCNHEVLCEDLAACEVILPSQSSDPHGDPRSPELKQSKLQSDDVVSLGDSSFAGKIPETVEYEEGHEDPQPETYKANMLPESNNNTETGTGILPNRLNSTSGAPHNVEQKGYSVLVDIQYPFKGPMGAMRYIENPTRQGLLQIISQILATHEILSTDFDYCMKSLSVRKGNNAYDILGYAQDHIGDLLDNVVRSEILPMIECIYSVR